MRELEFLPARYWQARRHRRLVAMRPRLTFAVAVALALWLGVALNNVRRARGNLNDLPVSGSQSRDLHPNNPSDIPANLKGSLPTSDK